MIMPANINTGPTKMASIGKCALSMQASQNSRSPVQKIMWGLRSTIQCRTGGACS
jgi:hypothetical protein